MSKVAERTLINIKGQGTVIARPTLEEYKNFLVGFCPNPTISRADSTRDSFANTEQLKPGQSITFRVNSLKENEECIHAVPESFETPRIIMIIDKIQNDA